MALYYLSKLEKLIEFSPVIFSGLLRVDRNLHLPQKYAVKSYSTALLSSADILRDPEGKYISIKWKEAVELSKYPATWLRLNCSCEKCRQPSSGQRLISCKDIPNSPTLGSIDLKGDQLTIHWVEDGHNGIIPFSRLLDAAIYKDLQPTVYANKYDLPTFDYPELEVSSDLKLELFINILEHGFALVQNLPPTEGNVKVFVEQIFQLPVQRTIYGEVFDVVSTANPINVAYSNVELKLHIDLAYYESPPGLQLLHCLRFDDNVQGGDSTLLDAFSVAEEMRVKFPSEFATLANIPATFEKVHFDREWPVYMRYRRPHIALNSDGQNISGTCSKPNTRRNLANFFHVSLSLFEGPLIPPENFDTYYGAYRKFNELLNSSSRLIQFRLKPSEMIVFNNRRMLHGRTAFTIAEGIRHFQGAYVNIDEFKSQCQVALVKKGLLPPSVPRVSNQSH